MSRKAGATRALARGLMRRCPRCGSGGLFTRWTRLAERCPRCGLKFEREEGAFLGSLVLNYGVTALLEIGYLIAILVLTLPHPNVLALTAGAVAIAVLVPLFVYPFAKTTWSAIDLILHPEQDEAGR